MASQAYPSICTDSSGNFVIAWEDNRNESDDIYYQCYDSIGTAMGKNTKVNDDAGTSSQRYPSISIAGSGNFVIAWVDNRNGNYDIYYQLYDRSGTAIGVNTKANDDIGTAYQYDPSVSMGCSGNFVIAWEDYRNGAADIYYQRYNSTGATIGENTKANDDSGTANQRDPSISMGCSSNFVIAWGDYRSGAADIHYQRYDGSGTPIGVNIKANDASGAIIPSISMTDRSNFVIAWDDGRNGNRDIYYQRYDSSGTAIGVNTKANDDSGTANQRDPSISMDDSGNFGIVWEDYSFDSEDPLIVGQAYFKNGSPFSSNYQIVKGNPYHWELAPVIAANNNRVVFAWMDPRRGQGFDIFAKIVGWDWEGDVPVEMTSFEASVVGNDVELNWTTATETNNLGFEVQKKVNDEFVKIAFVNGHGTTSQVSNYSFADEDAAPGKYSYRLNQIDYDGTYEFSKIVEVNVGSLKTCSLSQNYPNPFNPSTKKTYAIPTPPSSSPLAKGRNEVGFVSLKVYDILGNEVATLVNEVKPAGTYEIDFEPTNLPSGVYFYQLKAGSFIETKKMILLR